MAPDAKRPLTPDLPESIRSARAQWRWNGQARPPFAATPGLGQTSVWDFPRPPRLAHDTREVVVRWGDVEVARTRRDWHLRGSRSLDSRVVRSAQAMRLMTSRRRHVQGILRERARPRGAARWL